MHFNTQISFFYCPKCTLVWFGRRNSRALWKQLPTDDWVLRPVGQDYSEVEHGFWINPLREHRLIISLLNKYPAMWSNLSSWFRSCFFVNWTYHLNLSREAFMANCKHTFLPHLIDLAHLRLVLRRAAKSW